MSGAGSLGFRVRRFRRNGFRLRFSGRLRSGRERLTDRRSGGCRCRGRKWFPANGNRHRNGSAVLLRGRFRPRRFRCHPNGCGGAIVHDGRIGNDGCGPIVFLIGGFRDCEFGADRLRGVELFRRDRTVPIRSVRDFRARANRRIVFLARFDGIVRLFGFDVPGGGRIPYAFGFERRYRF